jgi:hypothetical protein
VNLNETGRIMKMIKAAYPNFDKSGNAKDIAALWAWRFKETDFKTVFEAVGTYIDGDHAFAPTVGQIKAVIRASQPTLSAADGWAEIARALKDSLANAEAEFNKLSPPVRAYVKSPQTLRSLAGCDIASRFFTDYQAQFFARFTAAQADETPDYAALNSPGNNQKAIESREDKGVKSD